MATYRSARRERQAQSTREDIVRAARSLFAERGYAATSMNDLAAAADVAVPTIYASVGSKRDLLIALLDLIDDEADVGPLNAQLADATTGDEVVYAGARITRQINERCGDIVGALHAAASTDPDVAAALEDGLRRHRDGTMRAAKKLGKLGALRDGLTVKRAGAIFSVVSAHGVYAELTHHHGWSWHDCEAWVARTLREQLLKDG
jgi:AcrR family transcriptional regulator